MYNNFERDNIQQEKIIDVIEDKKDQKKGKRKTIKLLTGALVVGMLAGVGFEGVHYVADRIQQSQTEKETDKEQKENK